MKPPTGRDAAKQDGDMLRATAEQAASEQDVAERGAADRDADAERTPPVETTTVSEPSPLQIKALPIEPLTSRDAIAITTTTLLLLRAAAERP